MMGEMYIGTDDFGRSMEYIVISELYHVIGLMEPLSQDIIWVTRNTLKYKYKKRAPRVGAHKTRRFLRRKELSVE